MRESTFNRSRRDFLRAGLYAVGVSAALPSLFQQLGFGQAVQAMDTADPDTPRADKANRILVVVELSGGNDGLNTVVPYADDVYHRLRPRIRIPDKDVLKLDDGFGLHPNATGLESLYKDGRLAIVHGCGYPDPTLSHFTAME